MKCQCGRDVEEARIKILESTICSICAKNKKTSKVKGIMIWDHKTAPYIQIVDEQTHKQFHEDTDRKGQKSILRTKSPGLGRPQ